MHGLFNRSIQCFLADTYGAALWTEVAREADIDPPAFEALLSYDDALTERMLKAAERLLSKPREEILEDVGTYLVSHPSTDAVRRLLRFGGPDFTSFLFSLDHLRDRARLAMPDLDMPQFRLTDHGDGTYVLDCRCAHEEFCHVALGALRAMADDYGVLVSLDCVARGRRAAAITIRVCDTGFTRGRSFALGVRAS